MILGIFIVVLMFLLPFLLTGALFEFIKFCFRYWWVIALLALLGMIFAN